MPQNITVVIIDSDITSLNNMTKYIENLGDNVSLEGTAGAFEKGFEIVHKKRPMVVIMEIGDDINLAIERIEQLSSRFSQVSIFATSNDKSSETILRVMRAGATEYLLRPVSNTDLMFALQKLGRLWLVKPAEEATGKIITVFSPKGGAGVTTIAINLATNIHEMNGKSTVLVDLDLNAGDVTTFLNMKPSYTISDVTMNISRLDRNFLQGVISKHDSGISVLAEPQKIEEGVSISSSEIKKVLGILKSMYNYIIIDAETISERTTTAIEMADMVLLVFFMSLPSIKNIQRHLTYFDRIGLGRDRVKLIANRYLKKGDITIQDTEKALNYPIFFTLPNEYDTTMSCLNKGVPISVGAPRSPLNAAMKNLAKSIITSKQ